MLVLAAAEHLHGGEPCTHDHGAWSSAEKAAITAAFLLAGVVAAAALLVVRRRVRKGARGRVPCPGCGVFIPPGAACPGCGAGETK